MITPQTVAKADQSHPIVYIRPVATSDLPQEIQEQVDGVTQLFAVHDADGERLALVANRRLAFALARENHLTPVHIQ
ncbi:DUF1150 family protein [Pseudoruegeria sp. SK021]|uniref:DUF1150 family protein n=1 Tax=Pseudoruegeria sp. SK021 TaxID=1933035 RepID=UPI000A24905E|nr:DUF1150 family protein [Pseudoruegeria sp. SK021]OSP54151.1 hypothetical protein BV911_13930 [Pseudoruegeria sp. SK021]